MPRRAVDERLLVVTKCFLAFKLKRGCKASGVKRIRVHVILHSHVSLLIKMSFSALVIAERMGHEAVDITYRYVHLFPTKQEEMVATLDGAKGGGCRARIVPTSAARRWRFAAHRRNAS